MSVSKIKTALRAAEKAFITFESKGEALRDLLQGFTEDSIIIQHFAGDGYGVGLEGEIDYADVNRIIKVISEKGAFSHEDIQENGGL